MRQLRTTRRALSLKVEIRPATLRDLSYTAANAREIDRRELYASGPRSPSEAGWVTWYLTQNTGGEGYCVWLDGNPEFAFGFTCQSQLTPWLYSAWAWGSEKTIYCMPELHRWGAVHVLPTIKRLGAERVEARSLFEHTEAHRWMQSLGFRKEAVMDKWGRNGERFVLLVWIREEFERGEHQNVRVRASTYATAAAASGD